jgi:hypothetical protein
MFGTVTPYRTKAMVEAFDDGGVGAGRHDLARGRFPAVRA